MQHLLAGLGGATDPATRVWQRNDIDGNEETSGLGLFSLFLSLVKSQMVKMSSIHAWVQTRAADIIIIHIDTSYID